MIGFFVAGLLFLQQGSWSDWQQFAVRQNGFGDTAFLYDGSSRTRSGDIVSAWVTYDFHYSGRNPTTHVELWEIHCRLRTSRARGGFSLDGASSSIARRRRIAFRPIAPASPQALLAERLCR